MRQGIFLTYIVSLCVYPDITAWLRPAAARAGGADGPAAANPPAVLPLGIRLRGDLLVPLTFVVFNTARARPAVRPLAAVCDALAGVLTRPLPAAPTSPL